MRRERREARRTTGERDVQQRRFDGVEELVELGDERRPPEGIDLSAQEPRDAERAGGWQVAIAGHESVTQRGKHASSVGHSGSLSPAVSFGRAPRSRYDAARSGMKS